MTAPARQFLGEADERALRVAEMKANKFLAALVDRFSPEEIDRAALECLGYPARLSHTYKEASAISDFLS